MAEVQFLLLQCSAFDQAVHDDTTMVLCILSNARNLFFGLEHLLCQYLGSNPESDGMHLHPHPTRSCTPRTDLVGMTTTPNVGQGFSLLL